MSERTILVCDECGRPASKSVTIRVDGRNLVKDLCDADLRALIRNARTPKRGRKPGTVLAAPKAAGARRGPGRPKGSKNKRSTAKRSTAKRSTAKRSTAKRPANGRRRRRTAKS
jgi:hypothetical protein